MSEYNRVYNFSAGPSVLPVEVLEKVQKDLLNYNGSGQSVMEMSHRSKEYIKIIEDAEADLRELMNIPDNYKVMFLQGGGTLQFAMVPINLLRNSRKADYVITGTWAKKAYKEACKFGDVKAAASSEEDKFTWVPKITADDIRSDADYVYITTNNTIYGTKFNYIPETGDIPLVADMSSNILSEEIDVTKFGLIWAGAQKNVGPAGATIVIIREDLIGYANADHIPTYLDYKIQAENGSMYNTPPCFSIYVAGEVFKYLKSIGGIKEMERRNIEKAFKTSKYNAERLVENTISDVRADMFEEFCKYTGVERVTRNAVLDGATCAECKELDGETYSLDDPNRPKAKLHLKCRCFYTVES